MKPKNMNGRQTETGQPVRSRKRETSITGSDAKADSDTKNKRHGRFCEESLDSSHFGHDYILKLHLCMFPNILTIVNEKKI